MRAGLARLNASSMMSSSIRFSLTGGQVGWTTKTSRPRTSSSMRAQVSPSGKLPSVRSSQRHAEVPGNPLGERPVGPAAEDLELVVVSVAEHRLLLVMAGPSAVALWDGA